MDKNTLAKLMEMKRLISRLADYKVEILKQQISTPDFEDLQQQLVLVNKTEEELIKKLSAIRCAENIDPVTHTNVTTHVITNLRKWKTPLKTL